MMLPDDDDLDNDISSTATLERSRIERTNRAFDALGRLGKAHPERVEAVWHELREAMADKAAPLRYRGQCNTRRDKPLSAAITLSLLQWLVELEESFPGRSPERHAGENGMGVSARQCMALWRRMMPERVDAGWRAYRAARNNQD